MRSEHGVRLWKNKSIRHCRRRVCPAYIGVFYGGRFLGYIRTHAVGHMHAVPDDSQFRVGSIRTRDIIS